MSRNNYTESQLICLIFRSLNGLGAEVSEKLLNSLKWQLIRDRREQNIGEGFPLWARDNEIERVFRTFLEELEADYVNSL